MPERTSNTFDVSTQPDSAPTTGHLPYERVPVVEEQESWEITLESVHNVDELLDAWLNESRKTTDINRKIGLAYCILKMRQALGLAGLDALEVRIRDYDSDTGTVGFYEETTGEIGMTPKSLELPPEHFADVLVHESAHAGKITRGRRIFDEGFTELLTVRVLPNALRGYYEKEQQKAGEIFDEARMKTALEKYDFDNPMALVVFYLGVEWNDRWPRIKADLTKEQLKSTFHEDAFLEAILEDNKDVEERLKEGAPDIYNKIKNAGFDFKEANLDILEHFLTQEKK